MKMLKIAITFSLFVSCATYDGAKKEKTYRFDVGKTDIADNYRQITEWLSVSFNSSRVIIQKSDETRGRIISKIATTCSDGGSGCCLFPFTGTDHVRSTMIIDASGGKTVFTFYGLSRERRKYGSFWLTSLVTGGFNIEGDSRDRMLTVYDYEDKGGCFETTYDTILMSYVGYTKAKLIQDTKKKE